MSPKIRYDVTDVEEREFKPPKPGVYTANIDEIEAGESKAGNPQLRIVLKITGGDFNGALLFHYVPTEPDAPGAFRMLELLKVTGHNRKKGTLDTDSLVGKTIRVRVKGDSYEGEYTAKVGTLMPPGEDEEDEEDLSEEPKTAKTTRRRRAAKPEPEEEEDDEADDEGEEDEEDLDDEEEGEDGEDEGEGDEEEGDDYDEWSITELKEELGNRGLRTAGKKTVLIGRLRKDDEAEADDPFSG